jgi:hypothetical protein
VPHTRTAKTAKVGRAIIGRAILGRAVIGRAIVGSAKEHGAARAPLVDASDAVVAIGR